MLKTRRKSYKKSQNQSQKKRDPHNYQDYLDYLKTPEWKKKSIDRKKIDEYRCQMCGKPYDLNVPHITYIHVYHEPMDDLITLCSCCHKKVHEEMKWEGRKSWWR